MKGGLVKWNDHQMTHLTGSSQRISFQSIFKANISQTVETCIICTQSQLSGWLLESIKCFQIKIKCLLQLSSFNSCPLWINITRHQYKRQGISYFFTETFVIAGKQNCPILHNHFTCLPDCGRLLYGQLKSQSQDPWFSLIQLVLLFIACCVTVSVVHRPVVVCLLASARLPPTPLHCHQEKIPRVRILRNSSCLILETADL